MNNYKENNLVRLQKFIADCGITSRRKAEELIVQGRVKVNSETITELGTKVEPSIDVVFVDGQVVDMNSVNRVYLLMNKPRGYVTTVNDPEGRRTVMELCKEVAERIYPVGRLDYLSEGLLLMTNDGEVANLVMHPSYEITKVYEVKVFGAVSDGILKKLRAGITIEDSFVKPLGVRVIEQLPSKTWLEFRLGEGKNREIRKICESCGLTVDKLRRIAIGGLSIDGIKPGSFRYYTKKQLLAELGVNVDGSKRNDPNDYLSNKKTINVKQKGHQNCTLADDVAFQKFRRGEYFDTVKKLNETKALKAKEERRASWEEKELKREKRETAKVRRNEKKAHMRTHGNAVKKFRKK